MDGAALEVGKNRRQVIQGHEKPLPAIVDLFTLGDVMGQVLQDHGSFFTVFLCDRPGEGVGLARVRGGVNCIGIDILDRQGSFHPARFLSMRGHFVERRSNLKIISRAVNIPRTAENP